ALMDIKGARAEGIFQPRRLAVAVFFDFRLPLDHLGGRGPDRPFALVGDMGAAVPFETRPADADAVTHGAALGHGPVEEAVGRIDHYRAGLFAGDIVHFLPPIDRVEQVDGRRR